MMRTMKTKTEPVTAAVADAVAPAAHLSIPSLPAAVMQLVTAQYMMLADKELSAGALQEKVANNYANVGVVAALALSMVGIAPGDVGESLVDSVTLETCQHVYTILMSCALVLLILAVLLSLQFYVMSSECTVKGEMTAWTTAMGKYVNVHYIFMILGMWTYMAGMVWLSLTLLPLVAFTAMAVVMVLVLVLAVYMQALGVQSLYKARAGRGKPV